MKTRRSFIAMLVGPAAFPWFRKTANPKLESELSFSVDPDPPRYWLMDCGAGVYFPVRAVKNLLTVEESGPGTMVNPDWVRAPFEQFPPVGEILPDLSNLRKRA